MRSRISSLSQRLTRRQRPLVHSVFIGQPEQAAGLEYWIVTCPRVTEL